MNEDGTRGTDERELWERILSTPQETEFREFVLDQLELRPDEPILSVGCGPGFETIALARRIPDAGRIHGVDVDEEVLAAARNRCRHLSQVSLTLGDITDLPVASECYDLAIAKQVLSQVSDVDSALAELFRVLEPGGRLAVTAGDRRAHVKHTPTRLLQRADDVYRAAMADRQLGTRLVGLLPAAGFEVDEIVPRAKLQTGMNDQVEHGITVQRQLLRESDAFDEDDVERWERELRDLADADQFLATSTAVVYVARKPA